MLKYLLALSALCLSLTCLAQDEMEPNPSTGIISVNSDFTYKMVEPVEDLRKLDLFLDLKKNGALRTGGLTVGASLIGIMDYQHSNIPDKFGYLMRHPTANNQRTQNVSEAVLHSANIMLAGSVNSWLSIYTEFLYNPEQSFGAGTTTTLTRNLVQLRKGFVMIGNLDKMPLYFALGKMDGNFGQQGSVSPFTNSTMWHAFGTLAYGAQFGYTKSGLNASIMLIQGGSQFRAANVPVDGTAIPSSLNNYSVDANYTFKLGASTKLQVGASYQKGTTYCQGFPVFHFIPCEDHNPALAYYGKLDYKNLTLQASSATTTREWPGTFNPNPPLDVFEASKVSSLVAGLKYRFNNSGPIKFALSGEFSNFVAGPDGSPWERQTQIILGLAGQVEGNSKLFVEVFRTMGYAPLNFVSGGNFDDLGVSWSDSSARSTGIVVGGMIFI